MIRKLAAWLATAAVVALGVAWHPNPGSAANNTLVIDDFSTDSKLWTYIGNATRTSDGKIRLTASAQNQVGTIWLKQGLAPPYTVNYKFQMTGIDPSGVGADGIAFMFNKKQNVSPVTGGGMGFELGNGYGIEFDSYSNEFDPNYNHIALFKDNPNHTSSRPLAQVQETTFENSQWHSVKINVGTGSVKVYLDGALKMSWSGTIDNAFNGIGFTASTGYYYNTQYIDDVEIVKPAVVTGVTSSLANGAYKAGTVIPIRVSFNDPVTVAGTPLLTLNSASSRTASYVSGSGTRTLTFNYVVQAGDNTADLNYTSISALLLNSGDISDSAGNPADLALPAITAATSLGDAKNLIVDTLGPSGTISVSGGSPLLSLATLALSATDAGSGVSQMRFSNDNSTWSNWENYAIAKSYTLPSISGTKTVYVQYRDVLGNVSSVISSVLTPPKANGGTFTINEDTPATNKTLSVTPGSRTISHYEIAANPGKGTLTLNSATGLYTYTPHANVNGTDTFNYRVSDGVLNSAEAAVTVTITPVNDAPVAVDIPVNVQEDVATTGTLRATDVEGQLLTYSIVGHPVKGTVTHNSATGAYTYTPNANANGTDTFTFKASDSLVDSNIATVTLTITPVNDAPVPTTSSITAYEDILFSGSLTATDIDTSAASLSYSIVTNGSKGTVSITNPVTGAFTYTPAANLNGTDKFVYRAFDGIAYSADKTVEVTIIPINDAPSFVKGHDETVYENSGAHTAPGWATNISAGPSDESTQAKSFTVTSNTYAGLFSVQPSIDPSGTLTYTLESNATGIADIYVKLQDDGGTVNGGVYESSVQMFSIRVISEPLQIRNISLSSTSWVQNSVTVTTDAYSNETILLKKWAPGALTVSDFSTEGTGFTGVSFNVTANGTYTFYVETASYKAVRVFSVSYIDLSAPVITLKGDSEQHIQVGSSYIDPGAVITDDSLTGSLFETASSGTVNATAVGYYALTYNYTDLSGRSSSVTRAVYVVDTTPPSITLNGANPINVGVNETYADMGATASDNSGPLGSVTTTGSVDTSTAGTYILTYNAVDGSGNAAASVTRTVYVVDSKPPVLTHTLSITDWTAGTVTVNFTADGTGSPISEVKWASGEHSADYFASEGLTVTGSTYSTTENGTYTLFAKDTYGNTAVQSVLVSNIDRSPPEGSITINGGAQTAISSAVALQLLVSDPDSGIKDVRVSNTPIAESTGWMDYASTVDGDHNMPWNLDPSSVTQSVYVQYRDVMGNESPVYFADIVLDPDTPAVEEAIAALTNAFVRNTNPSLGQVTHNLHMPTEGLHETTIAWSSSNTTVIAVDGIVTRPAETEGDALVAITATVTKGNVSANKTFTVLVLREHSEERAYVSALTVTGGAMLVPFQPQQDEYLIYAAPEASSVTLIAQLADGPYRFAVDGASYSVSKAAYGLEGLLANIVIDPYSSVSPGTYSVTGTVYEVRVKFDKGTTFTLQVQSKLDDAVLKSYTFNIVRSLPWIQVAVTNDTDSEIVLIGRESLLTTTALQPSSFKLDEGPAITGASYDVTDPEHRTVLLTLAEPIGSGQTVKLAIDAGLITESGQVVSFTGYPIFSTIRKQQVRREADTLNDGLHMDDTVQFLDKSNGDINSDGMFNKYDVELILKLIDSRSFIAK